MSTNLPLRSLAKFLAEIRAPVENFVFKGKTVHLDGYASRNCAFVNCVLVTGKGNFRLEECFAGNGSVSQFYGDALRVVKFAGLINWEGRDMTLWPEWHQDGSVSIK